MKKIYFLAATAALLLTACDKDTSGDTPMEPSSAILRISASIDEAYSTRAEGGSWNKGDRIGVITTVGELVPESFHPYVNLEYTTEKEGSNSTLSGPEMLFYNHLTISGYHPYQGSEGIAPGGTTDGYLIKTDTRINKQFDNNNKEIDFLHASKTGIKLAEADKVNLDFSHKMTKLTFTFLSNKSANNKVNVANLTKYQVEGLVMDGSFNTLTGECIADSNEDAEDLVIEGLYMETEDGNAPESRIMESLIVFPQTPKGEVRLRMFLDETHNEIEDDYQIYFCTIRFGENMLKPGYHYNFNVNITKAGLQMGEISIVDWDKGVNSTIIATIDGEDPVFEENEENEED